MSDSKTVGAWKDLITKVVGPALQKSNRTDPQRSLKSADQSRGIISDQLATLNKQYDIDSSNQQILLDIVDQYRVQTGQLDDIQKASILNTNSIVSHLAQSDNSEQQVESIANLSQTVSTALQSILQQQVTHL